MKFFDGLYYITSINMYVLRVCVCVCVCVSQQLFDEKDREREGHTVTELLANNKQTDKIKGPADKNVSFQEASNLQFFSNLKEREL